MPRFGGKEYTWFGILRYPVMMVSVIGMAGYMTYNFKTLFAGELERKRQLERDSYNQLYENSMKDKNSNK